MTLNTPECRIGLALSGGGVRAVAFHAGVMRWFAERSLLGKVTHISSVSGGSLLTGLIFRLSDYQWPSSEHYLNHVLPNIRTLLTTKSLQFDVFRRLALNPLNWRFVLSRANVLATSIRSLWGISGTLSQLPRKPVWSINGTTAENGRRFRFKAKTMGDYEIGYAKADNFRIADAMAMSAAFPGGIGPLRLDATLYSWFKRESWGSKAPEKDVPPPHDTLHVYDGGVYDNLGMETFFDTGKQVIKTELTVPIDFLLVVDAGSPFSRQEIPGPLHYKRLIRVAGMISDQARALRIRSFVNFLNRNPSSGMYLQIGSEPLRCIRQYAKSERIGNLEKTYEWFSKDNVSVAAQYKTTLRCMNTKDFDLIEEHAYQTALWNESVFLDGR